MANSLLNQYQIYCKVFILKMSQELYLEYNRILKDEIFGVKYSSPIYKIKNGEITTEYKVDKKGKYVINIYKNKSIINTTKTWYYNGDFYKKIYESTQYSNYTKYFKNGVLHRDNKPAYIYENYEYRAYITEKKWYKNGMIHNEEGPAYIMIEDETHEINDPYYHIEELYFLNNEQYKKEKYYEYITKIKKQEICDKLYEYNISCKDVCEIISSYVY